MAQVRVTLHRKGKEPLSVQVWLDPETVPAELADTQVSLSVGDSTASSAVTVPVDILSMLMAKVMAKAASQSGIVVPGPRVIIPN
jgi:P pilus assembly chaperone PapD